MKTLKKNRMTEDQLEFIVKMGERFAASGMQFAAAPYAGAIAHPLGPPTVTNTTLTVDMALNSPQRITRMVMDLTKQRFFVDRVFSSGGGVTGGAVIYDELAGNDLYADRDVQRVAPGSEFPEVTFSRRAPKVAEVEKWGGKFFFTDEARDRNNVGEFTRAIRQLSNTIVRKINQRGVDVIEAAVTANSRTVVGNSWGSVVTTGASASAAALWPAFDFADANRQADVEELGVVYDLWIINPQEYLSLATVYGPDLDAMLASVGYDLYVTNRVPAGTAYVVASGQVGEMRLEKPLGSETWRDPDGKEQTWVQSSVRPLFFIDNPYAVLKFTGLT